jgi:chromosome segregation ATPase
MARLALLALAVVLGAVTFGAPPPARAQAPAPDAAAAVDSVIGWLTLVGLVATWVGAYVAFRVVVAQAIERVNVLWAGEAAQATRRAARVEEVDLQGRNITRLEVDASQREARLQSVERKMDRVEHTLAEIQREQSRSAKTLETLGDRQNETAANIIGAITEARNVAAAADARISERLTRLEATSDICSALEGSIRAGAEKLGDSIERVHDRMQRELRDMRDARDARRQEPGR